MPYATLGSMDATMWQANERKARFIAAALAGDRSIRTLEDMGRQANQFALAKVIASGDPRLIQKAGLESEIARLERQRAAHFDDQLNIRRQIRNAMHDIEAAETRIPAIRTDLVRCVPTRGDVFAFDLNNRAGGSPSDTPPGRYCCRKSASPNTHARLANTHSAASAASISPAVPARALSGALRRRSSSSAPNSISSSPSSVISRRSA
jgi:hypothetical protein